MKVEVTQHDINKADRLRQAGPPSKSTRCPIALAVKELLLGFEAVTTTSVLTKNCVYSLPPAAQEFIERWDNEKVVSPFEFELPTTLF